MEYRDIRTVTVVGVAFLLFSHTFVFAQAPDTLWVKIYNRDWDDRAYSIKQTPDSGYIIAASTGPDGVTHDIWLLKTDANGDTLWTKTYGGAYNDECYEIQLTSDGGFIITGWTESFGAGDADIWLLKTDSLGDTLWTKTYGGTALDHGGSVKQTPDGGYIVAGLTFSFGAGEQDVYLIKTDSLGDTLWTRTYGGVASDAAMSVQLTSDKGYILAGTTRLSPSLSLDGYLIKTDSLGDTLWTKTYGESRWWTDFFESVQQTFDNGYIMTGFTVSYGNAGELYLVRTDENGDTLWARHWGNPHNMDYGYSVIQIHDSSYIVAGYYSNSTGADHYTDVWILKVDKAGDTVWTAKYGRYAGYFCDEWAYEVQRTFDGGYILAGKTGSWSYGHIYLIRLAPDTLGVHENHRAPLPLLNLEVYPNPFTKLTTISLDKAQGAECIELKIYDATGRIVKDLSCPPPDALSPMLIRWDGRDNAGDKLPSGIYFLKCQVGDHKETKKLVLLK